MTQATPPTIRYTLGMSHPATHLLEVTITCSGLLPGSDELTFVMPAWRTGRYVIFDFANGVQEFSAFTPAAAAVPWRKTDKQTWRVETRGMIEVTIRYLVYANEFYERTRGLDDDHAFIDGAAVFMYVEQFKDGPLTLEVHPRAGWHVTTGLKADAARENRFLVDDYQILSDCPIEVGTQKEFPFDAEGVPHVLMIAGEGNYDAPRLIEDLKRIIHVNKQFWGELPYERFIFMVHCLANGGGGTEHLNSTIMQTRPFIFKDPGSYRGFLGLIAHEYFHTWNVKQMRPSAIQPYDFSKEAYSKEYWIAEGTTSYYGPLLMLRAGYGTAEGYLEAIANSVQGDRSRPGNRVQSLSESSFDAWVKYWKGNRNAYDVESDYYDKGSDISQILDLEIRERSGNSRSLDDVMRSLYHFCRNGHRGYTVDDLQRFSEGAAGESLKEFFAKYVHGTEPVPWERFYLYAGIRVAPREGAPTPWIGLVPADQGTRTMVDRVVAGSPAYEAGISPGDELVAVNGYRMRAYELPRRISELSIGDTLRLTLFRDERLRQIRVTIGQQAVPPYHSMKVEHPTELQRTIYESWLATSWEK